MSDDAASDVGTLHNAPAPAQTPEITSTTVARPDGTKIVRRVIKLGTGTASSEVGCAEVAIPVDVDGTKVVIRRRSSRGQLGGSPVPAGLVAADPAEAAEVVAHAHEVVAAPAPVAIPAPAPVAAPAKATVLASPTAAPAADPAPVPALAPASAPAEAAAPAASSPEPEPRASSSPSPPPSTVAVRSMALATGTPELTRRGSKASSVASKRASKRISTMMASRAVGAASPSSSSALTHKADTQAYPKDALSIHALPAHRKSAPSPLSKEAPPQSYRGLINVAGLLLIVSNLRLIIENLTKYGLLVSLPGASLPARDLAVLFGLAAFLAGTMVVSYSIEKTGALSGGTYFVIEKSLRRAAAINMVAILVVPTLFVWYSMRDPVAGTAVLNDGRDPYMQPILKNTMVSIMDPATGAIRMNGTTVVVFVERLLKLSVAVVYFWLLMFYSFFHAWVNLIAELTRFADREFYMAWWNCSTIAAYWRLWNQPVHKWLKRHVYVPMVAGRGLPDPVVPPTAPEATTKHPGYSKFQAALAIFFISAVFHELIIAPPVKILRLHAFNAMFLQIPLIVVSQVFDNWYRKSNPDGINTVGNLLMWTTFCVIGQPMGGMLYYIEWCSREKCIAF
ncbi:hypothetical protein AMAG_05861 [Allomyces macrogynus ATCC 38327]|uniref:diacylglycerol O-acyltransferase n=1 Tax=Allomyces macrogynus (strain ATCC 38327) TaxID=578462 RepID=A0A0L0SDL5_ALLM3|nr:hypothetical protein AMAG_05861 [Allomyces macrogynus ATCC 38327]|eukprot:KNE60475.1 hypothetical protein AMAG_05861 [Allomyces macrogynus ATCC 38327]